MSENCPYCDAEICEGVLECEWSDSSGRDFEFECPECERTIEVTGEAYVHFTLAPKFEPHPYEPMTMRDGSKACSKCYAPPSHPVHEEQ